TEISLEKRIQTAREALKSLQSKKMVLLKDQNTAPPQALIPKLIRPFYSRICLNKTSETLEIYLPPKGFTKLLQVEMGCFHLFILYCILFLIPPFLALFFTNLVLFLFLSAILGSSILFWIFFLIDEKTFVEFNHFQFRIFRKSRGLKYRLQSGSVGNIIGVFMEKKQSKYEVVIRTTSGTHTIGELFVAEECAWLTQEIQDWLYPR
ncbi:MAG: hypothetical protein ACRCU2_04730, partial [Planktothrix sp.]